MRQIEKRMLEAIELKKDMSVSNTSVQITNNCALVRLHGNLICVHDYSTGKRYYNTAGWCTNTTKSRLNALGANIYQKDFIWYQRPAGNEFKGLATRELTEIAYK